MSPHTISPSTSTALRATAFHEAAHAAVLIYFGLPVTRVYVGETDDALGGVEHPTPMMIETSSLTERRAIARQMILSSLAGVPGQKLVDSCPEPHAGEQDDWNAFELSRDYKVLPRRDCCIGDEVHWNYLERLGKESARLVSRLRHSIASVASRLLAVRELDGSEIESLVRERYTKG